VGDEVVPLDTQALGVVYARFLGDDDLAKQVYEYAQQNFAIDGRSIALSSKKASYNMTYEAKGRSAATGPTSARGRRTFSDSRGPRRCASSRASSASRPKRSTQA
jgi:hypothetical protein